MLKQLPFSPLQRIRTRLDFQHIFRKGRRLYSEYYILYYCPNDLKYPRIGVITSKKNAGNAIQRNQVKRVAREMFRLAQTKFEAIDIVLVAQKKTRNATKEELRQCLEELFAKLKS